MIYGELCRVDHSVWYTQRHCSVTILPWEDTLKHFSSPATKARRTSWKKTEIKQFYFSRPLTVLFSFKIKLQLNNAASGRLYFTRPHIPETKRKQNCQRSAKNKPRPSAILFYFSFISPCATGLPQSASQRSLGNKAPYESILYLLTLEQEKDRRETKTLHWLSNKIIQQNKPISSMSSFSI